MSVIKYPSGEDDRKKSHFSIVVFLAILVSLLFLITAFLLGNAVLREHTAKNELKAATAQSEASAGKKQAYVPKAVGENGEVLNIYGEPLAKPKPKYIPEQDTTAEDKEEEEDDKNAIYLEAVDYSNVHTEAGQDYPSVDVTEAGEMCKYLGVNEYGWLLIETSDGNEGYVYQTHFANIDEVIN